MISHKKMFLFFRISISYSSVPVVYPSSSDELIYRFGGVIFLTIARALLSRVVIRTLFNLLFCIMNILSYACIMKCLNVFVPLPCYNWNRHPWLLLILTDVALDWPLIVILIVI